MVPEYVDASTGFTFPSLNLQTITFPIPAATPSGQYLVRIEQIALHVASSFGGAQFYLACGQIQVSRKALHLLLLANSQGFSDHWRWQWDAWSLRRFPWRLHRLRRGYPYW